MPDAYDPTIAHIAAGDRVFQVLNADGDDWDEDATRAAYEAWLAEQE
jgi:hypothetical protein